MTQEPETPPSASAADARPNMEKPRESYRRMAAIANDANASDQERETARGIMAIYVARYGSEVQIPDAEPEITREIPTNNEADQSLASHCAEFTGCVAWFRGKRLWQGTKRETFRRNGETFFRGPESAVLGAVELFTMHQEKQQKVMQIAAVAYRCGAMRLPPNPKHNQVEMPDEFANVAAAAAMAGQNYAAKRLTAPKDGK